MQQYEALLQFQQALEQVSFANAKIRSIPNDYTNPETIAGHVAQWEDTRAKSAQRAVDALKAVLNG